MRQKKQQQTRAAVGRGTDVRSGPGQMRISCGWRFQRHNESERENITNATTRLHARVLLAEVLSVLSNDGIMTGIVFLCTPGLLGSNDDRKRTESA